MTQPDTPIFDTLITETGLDWPDEPPADEPS